MTQEQNLFLAKRNIVDYIWKSANLEGIGVTYPETQAIYDGGVVNGLTVDSIIAINNLKYAWQFILENNEIDYDFKALCHLHKLTCDKLVLDQNLGKLRTTPVNIGGTSWKPQFPIESQIKEELENLLNQPEKSKTEISIEIMLWIMRRQMFLDGNKRVAMLFANKIMIDNGCGIITISKENQPVFFEKFTVAAEVFLIDLIREFRRDIVPGRMLLIGSEISVICIGVLIIGLVCMIG